jgi:hypothetical protein
MSRRVIALGIVMSSTLLTHAAGMAGPLPGFPSKICDDWETKNDDGSHADPIRRDLVSVPSTGQEAYAEVGQSLLTTAKLEVYGPTATLSQSVVYYAPGKKKPLLTINSGTLRLQTRGEGGAYYVAGSADFTYAKSSFMGGGFQRVGIFVPKDKTQAPSVMAFSGLDQASFAVPNIQIKPTECTSVGINGFRRELVYSGSSKDGIQILYREYLDDKARPAFSQQLTYDLASGAEIGFGGARLKVIEATNVGIKFVVLKPLDGSR